MTYTWWKVPQISELLDRYFRNEDTDVCFFHSIIQHNYIGARVAQWVWQLDYLTTHTSLSPIRYGFAPGFVNCKTRCTRLAAVSDKAYQLQLLAHGLWFSPDTPASSITKTGCHDIAEILLKVSLNTINQIKSNHNYIYRKQHVKLNDINIWV